MARATVRQARSATVLARLPEHHWRQFHRVRCPGSAMATGQTGVGDPRPERVEVIDRVLVGPSGIYVILTVGAGTPAPLLSAQSAAAAVGAVLPARYRSRVKPVVVRDEDPRAEWYDEVLVTSYDTLEHIARSTAVVLSTSEVAEVVHRLGTELEELPVVPLERRRRWYTRKPVLAGMVGAVVAAAAGAVAYSSEILELVAGW